MPCILYGESDPNGDKDVYVPYVPAARIEQLERERDDLEAKLAKAMKALRRYVSKEKGVLHTADVVLAELEGKE
jgi:hypothetical protein